MGSQPLQGASAGEGGTRRWIVVASVKNKCREGDNFMLLAALFR
jgi:hypothetical protein